MLFQRSRVDVMALSQIELGLARPAMPGVEAKQRIDIPFQNSLARQTAGNIAATTRAKYVLTESFLLIGFFTTGGGNNGHFLLLEILKGPNNSQRS
jgi:hypothetical protein